MLCRAQGKGGRLGVSVLKRGSVPSSVAGCHTMIGGVGDKRRQHAVHCVAPLCSLVTAPADHGYGKHEVVCCNMGIMIWVWNNAARRHMQPQVAEWHTVLCHTLLCMTVKQRVL